eukprot:bmy_22136T0
MVPLFCTLSSWSTPRHLATKVEPAYINVPFLTLAKCEALQWHLHFKGSSSFPGACQLLPRDLCRCREPYNISPETR